MNEDGSVELRGLQAADSYSGESSDAEGVVERGSKGLIRSMGSAFKSMIYRGNKNQVGERNRRESFPS